MHWIGGIVVLQGQDKFVNRELRKLGWTVVRVWDFVS